MVWGTVFKCFLASGIFVNHLLITFANSLDSDQDRHSVGPDLDPKHLTLCGSVPERKVSSYQQKQEKKPSNKPAKS